MLKPIDMPTMTQRSVDLVQNAQEQLARAELSAEHAGRMNRQSVEQMANSVTPAEKSEFSRVSEKQESGNRGQEKGKKKEKEEPPQKKREAKLPNVGYRQERILDIEI